jgi:hypothetical protein
MENKVQWNNTKKQIAPLKGTVMYEISGIKQNPMATDRLEFEIPFMCGVPSTDRIVEDLGKGDTQVVDIAYIDSFGPGGVPNFGQITFMKANAGAIVLSDRKANDVKMYDYLERCNYNESNPDRDASKPIIFRKVNKAADLQSKRAKRKELRDALNIVETLGALDLRRLAIGLNITGIDDDDIRAKVEDFAEKDPIKLLTMLENKDTEIMRRAEDGKKAKIIVIDNQARHIKSASGETLFTWPPEKDVDWRKQFVRYVKSEDGQAFYKEMISQLDAKK